MLRIRCPIYVLLKIGIAQAQCYFPGGDLAPNQHYCNPNAYTTLCCESGWTCFDNGLCVVTDADSGIPNLPPVGSAARGTCTNHLWNETAYGNFCLDDPINDNDGSVISCGNQNWCCQPGAAAGTCNCASGDGTFSLQDGLAQTIIGIQGLENTNTDVIPISSASIPLTMASSSAITTSPTPSQIGATQDEPTTSSSPGYRTSASASAASRTTSSSSSSSSLSSQSSLTMTLQPTNITMTPTSGNSTASGSSSPTTSAGSSHGLTDSTAFKTGVAGGTIAAVVVVGFLFFLCLRKCRRHPNPPSPASAGQLDPSVAEHTNQDIDYRTQWPLHGGASEALTNRAAHGLRPIVLDHDQDRPVQPHLYGPIALDPYAVTPRDPDVRREASRLPHGPGAALSLNYRPTMRGANRPRGDAYRTMPRASQAWMPEVPEMTQD